MIPDGSSLVSPLQKEVSATIEGWERINFHFFDKAELENLHSQVRGLSVRRDRPSIAEVRCGLVHDLRVSFSRKNELLVGVYDTDNLPVEASIRFRGSPPQPGAGKKETRFDEVVQDDREAYYLGVKAIHYGHFLLETLCRAWAWEEFGEKSVPVLQVSPVRDFARTFYALIPGLDHVEVVTAPTRFRNVIVPSPAFMIAHTAYNEFKAMCVRMAERAIPPREPMTEQPIFISRAGLDPLLAKRPIVGELRLESFLAQQGFLIVRPETLPVPEQIRLFNRHKWIVAQEGSACHTRLFSTRPTNLLMLTSAQRLNTNFMLCDQLCEGTAHYANVLTRTNLGIKARARSIDPVVLNEENLLALLKTFGLVDATAAIDGRPPDIVGYKRAWIDLARDRLSNNNYSAKKTARLRREVEAISTSLDG